MDRIRKKYNPELGHLKAEQAITGLTKSEYQAWKDHPCTVALMETLEASLDGIVTTWVGGGFNGASVDTTAMNQAKATGMTEALDGVMRFVDEMLDMTQSETEYERARNNSGR